MSCLLHINDEFGRVQIECQDDEATIWIRAGRGVDTVSLSLNAANLDALEQAIADARGWLRRAAA